MFPGSFAIDYLDLLFWTEPRSRRFQLLASVLLEMRCPELRDICLQNCNIIESSFCALYMILDIEHIPSIDSLLRNPALREPANACMALLSLCVACSVFGRVYRFVQVDSAWRKLTTYIVTYIISLTAEV
jgi:hypothetical protein